MSIRFARLCKFYFIMPLDSLRIHVVQVQVPFRFIERNGLYYNTDWANNRTNKGVCTVLQRKK